VAGVIPRKVRAPWTHRQVTPGHVIARLRDGQCHREQTADGLRAQARVKRWGKSPPRRWRQRRHGKPRLEKGQIGSESQSSSTKTLRVGCWRVRATALAEE